jgi:hypothetical protein
MIEGSGSESVPPPNGSEFRRPKNLRILGNLILIRNIDHCTMRLCGLLVCFSLAPEADKLTYNYRQNQGNQGKKKSGPGFSSNFFRIDYQSLILLLLTPDCFK